MSGGEQQRVAIARAVAKRPAVLLCDEPTGALDVETGILVLDAIQRINELLGTTTAVITHNAVIADMADRVIHLSGGHITAINENTQKNLPTNSLGDLGEMGELSGRERNPVTPRLSHILALFWGVPGLLGANAGGKKPMFSTEETNKLEEVPVKEGSSHAFGMVAQNSLYELAEI